MSTEPHSGPPTGPPQRGRRGAAVTAAVLSAALVSVGIATVVMAAPRSAARAASISPLAIAGRGAGVPFTEYEAEQASTNGTVVGPDYTQGTVASEASGRRYVQLSSPGQYVEFTLTAAANAVDVAYNLNQGASGSLSVYVNGTKLGTKLALNSKYSYITTGNIAGSKTHHLFDDTRMMLGTNAAAGAKVRLQVDSGDVSPVNVDLADFEQVGAPIAQPANSLSVVTDGGADPTGAADSTAAINKTINDAKAQGKVVWLPRGVFDVTSPLQATNVTIDGAGPWYAELHGTHLIDNSSAGGALDLNDFAAIGEVTTRNDSSPDNFVNGVLGPGSTVNDIWIQHEKVGMWLVGNGNSNLTIENNRILDTTADGINFNGTVTDSTVKNNFIRNTGDDGIALWSLHSADSGDTITANTVVQPNLANGIALYGGSNNTLSDNVVADTNALGSGIAISNQQFIAGQGFSPLAGTITLTDNTTIPAGAINPNWGHAMSAIRFDAYDYAITANVNLTGTQVLDSPWSAFEIVGGAGTGLAVSNLTINGATVSNVGTVVVQAETQGSGSFSNITATGVGAAGIYNCSYPSANPPFSINQGSGNSGWSSVWPNCTFPPQGSTPPPTTTPSTTPPTSPPPGTNLALNKPASASGSVQSYVPGNAVDGNANTYWESTNNAFPQWLTVDLGSSRSVGRVVLDLPPSTSWNTRTQTLSVLGSTDGSHFSTVVGSAGYTFNPSTGDTVTIKFPSATTRYLRLNFTANTGWPAGQVSELQVFSS